MKKIRLLLTHILLVAMITSSISPAYVFADELSPAQSVQETTKGGADLPADAEAVTDVAEAEDEADDVEADDVEADDVEEDVTEADDTEADDVETDEIDDIGVEADEDFEDITAELAEAEILGADEFNDGSIKKPAVTDKREITKITPPEKTEYSFENEMILEELLENLPKELTVWHGDESNIIEIIWKCEKDYDEDLDEYPFVPDLEGYNLAEDLEIPRITVTFEKKWQAPPSGDTDKGNDLRIPEPDYEYDDSVNAYDTLPSSYNVYKMGKLPKVRDQGQWGTCWAHATIAAVEADLIHDKKANTSINLSELHTAYYPYNSYTDPKKCRKDKVTNFGDYYWLNAGGNMYTGMHLLSNLIGTVKEDVAKYKPYDYQNFHPKTAFVTSKDVYQLDRAYYYLSSDITGIKKAVMAHGAVMTSYYDDNSYYSKTYNSYYNADNYGSGHQIVIVGWNDNFSRKNFAEGTPSKNGAWLIRNSWGKNGYGRNGYFWMSYYDKSLLSKGWALALDAKKVAYKHCYAYDGMVFQNGFLYRKGTSTQKITYTVSGGEAVKAVGIEIGDPETVEVTVKNKRTGKSSKGSLKCPRMGFYTVKLKNPLNVPQKATVEVTIKYKVKSGNSTVVYEEPINGTDYYTGIIYNTKCDKGFTLNGTKINHDPRVKLFTGKAQAVKKVTKVKLNKSKVTLNKGGTVKLKATVSPKNATNKKVSWKSSKPKVATVNSSGKVTAKNPGTTTITATAKDGSKKKATCKVTVKKPKVKVKSVSLNYKTRTLKNGKTLNLKATVKPKNATNKKVKWTSSKPKVATVNSKGKVTAKSPGTATITATAKDGSKKKATCTITVKKK